MHELAITENIVEIAVGAAKGSRIKEITLVLGELSGVVEEAIRFCFEVISQETPAEGAEVCFVRIPAVVRCSNCGSEYHLNEGDWTCTQCGTASGEIVRGREFYIDSIQVEDNDEDQSSEERNGCERPGGCGQSPVL